jgi:hypothetical protein
MPRPPRPWPSIHYRTKAAQAPKTADQSRSQLPANLSFDLASAALNTGVTINYLRTAIKEQKLRARLIGQKLIILRADLARFLESLPVYVHPAYRRDR